MIYLNNSATSYPKPPEVIDAVHKVIEAIPVNHGRGGGDRMNPADCIEACRRDLATLFNIKSPEQLVFTSGSTEGLNGVINGLFISGDRVVTTVTEHNSVLRPLFQLEKRGLITLDLLPCNQNGYIEPTQIEATILSGKKPKAIIINHVSNVLGTVQDLKIIGNITKKHGVYLIVDASQSAGVVPIDVEDMGIDFMAFTAHKSLYGIQGSGGLYIRKGIDLTPWKVGGTGIKGGLKEQPDQLPVRYESGTPNTVGIVALHAGIEWVNNHTIKKLSNYKKVWVQKLQKLLTKHSEITLYTQESTVCAFNIEGMVPIEVAYMLREQFGIVVRGGLHCTPLIYKAISAPSYGVVRVSPSSFSTEDELNRLYEAIVTIIEIG